MDVQGVVGEGREWAFYYPGPEWYSSDCVKNLILFFDGIALLVPDYMRARYGEQDPALVAGLEEHGLLHLLEPKRLMDKAAAEKLAEAMTAVIASGALDGLSKMREFQTLSMSRLGSDSDVGLSLMIFQELRERGLARDSQDGV